MNTTTKTYPRTTVEAFPDAHRAGCVQGPYRAPSRIFWPVLAPVTALLAIIGAVALIAAA